MLVSMQGDMPAYPASREFHDFSGMTIREVVALRVFCALTATTSMEMYDAERLRRAFRVADEFEKQRNARF